MDIQKQHLCPRLVDYLTIVGAKPYTSGKGLAPVQVSWDLALFLLNCRFQRSLVKLKPD